MTTSRRFQTNFNKKILSEFWYEVSKDYLFLGKSAVTLCYHMDRRISAKKPLSSTALNKTRHRNYLPLEMYSTLATITVSPRIEKPDS